MSARAWQARKPVSGVRRRGWLSPREERAFAQADRRDLREYVDGPHAILRNAWQPRNRRERRRLRK